MSYPNMVKVRQVVETAEVADIPAAVRSELARAGLKDRIKSGQSVALTAGSRGIASLPAVLKTIAEEVRALGAQPFIVPAMGSHGGGTAEGQVEILEGLGITEAAIGVPIIASMETVHLGETENGIPVYMDKNAYNADAILLANRLKVHSPWSEIGSGLQKVAAIGLGKQKGCSTIHSWSVGTKNLYKNIQKVAGVMFAKAPIVLGVAIVDNANARPARIVALTTQEIPEVEPKLVAEARDNVARLPFDDIDLLIVGRIGKNISPGGLDPLVVGTTRSATREPGLPVITRIIVQDLTDESHGNCIGVSRADFITRRFERKINYQAWYMNALSANSPEGAKLPCLAETDQHAVDLALNSIGPIAPERARVIRVKDTLHLDEVWISDALAERAAGRPGLEIIGPPEPLRFSPAGDLV